MAKNLSAKTKVGSIIPTAKDYESVLGSSSVSTRGNTKVCICTCVHCRIGSASRLVSDAKGESTFR